MPILAVNCRSQSSPMKGLLSEDSASGTGGLTYGTYPSAALFYCIGLPQTLHPSEASVLPFGFVAS